MGKEGQVCENDGQDDEAYCSYGISSTACAYCTKPGCSGTNSSRFAAADAVCAGIVVGKCSPVKLVDSMLQVAVSASSEVGHAHDMDLQEYCNCLAPITKQRL